VNRLARGTAKEGEGRGGGPKRENKGSPLPTALSAIEEILKKKKKKNCS
jgi:hypothetical protein